MFVLGYTYMQALLKGCLSVRMPSSMMPHVCDAIPQVDLLHRLESTSEKNSGHPARAVGDDGRVLLVDADISRAHGRRQSEQRVR